MDSHNRMSSWHISWLKIGNFFALLFLSFLVFASLTFGNNDDKPSGKHAIITLIPTYTDKNSPEPTQLAPGVKDVLLPFNLKSLPANAEITNARLILVTNNKGQYGGETIKVWIGDTILGSSSPSSEYLTVANQPVIWDVDKDIFKNLRGQISLKLTSEGKGDRRTWHSSKSESSKNRPRLVLEYAIPGEPVTQSDGLPDVRSPRAFLPSATPKGASFSYEIRPFPKAWSYMPAFFSGRVYIITDSNGKKTLRVLDPLGNELSNIELSSNNIGQHLLILNDGRLYIVGADRIIVYKLDSNSAFPDLTASPIDFAVTDLKPDVAPALGPDGSLYFVNYQKVFGFNPDLQELWKVTLQDKTTSRITVGPGGKYIYLSTKGKGLVAINAQTGNELPKKNTIKDAAFSTLSAPVVIRHPDGTEKIYVAGNSTEDGALACFNNNIKEIKPCLGAWNKLNGLWSQIIPDQLPPDVPADPEKGSNKKIYAVRVVKDEGGTQYTNGTLEVIDWLPKKSVTEVTKVTKLDFKVAEESYLVNGGNLAMDLNGECFIWNKADKKIGLYALGAGNLKLIDVNSDIPSKAQLFFGSDGTLYAYGIDDRILKAIVPRYTFKSAADADKISSPTHLRVDGTVSMVSKETTLTAAGIVILGPEFTVKQGSTLKISTGVK